MANKGNFLNSAEIIKEVGISLRQLYYWEMKGIIRPESVKIGTRKFKRYSEEDIDILKKIKEFLDEGYTLKAAIQKVKNNPDVDLRRAAG